MRNLIGIPLLAGAVILQATVVSQITLLGGSADIVLLLVLAWAMQPRVSTSIHWALLAAVMSGISSRLEWPIFVLVYVAGAMLASRLRDRLWNAPILGMFLVVFISTVGLHGLALTGAWLVRGAFDAQEALARITLPAVLLNLVLAAPAYWILRDLGDWVTASEALV